MQNSNSTQPQVVFSIHNAKKEVQRIQTLIEKHAQSYFPILHISDQVCQYYKAHAKLIWHASCDISQLIPFSCPLKELLASMEAVCSVFNK